MDHLEEDLEDFPPVEKANPLIGGGIGIVIGAAAALWQIMAIPYGGLAPDQMKVFWAAFLGLGFLVGIPAVIAGNRLFRSRGIAYGTSLLATGILFAILVPMNTRGEPNVLLLVTDATRADHLSLYGYQVETTPYLDSQRDELVVFTNGVSQGTHTIVSTPCILASVYPSQHGIVSYSNVLSSRFTLLSEYLSDAGYQTYGYATNPHLGPRQGYSQGFDKFEHDPNWAHTPAGRVNGKFLNWIDGREEDRPLFGFLFYIDPHNPYEPPPAYQKLFDPEWDQAPVSDWKHELGKPEQRVLQNLLAQYDGAIAYWDSELRKLVSALETRGEWENTLVIYTSDHGEEFWEHGFWGHNKIIYEGSVHVPMVLSIPSPVRFPPMGRTGQEIDDVVSSVDIVPTVLEYLGLEPDETARGRSALPLVYGNNDGPERIAYHEELLQRYGPYDIRGIRTKDRKYIRVINFEGQIDPGDLYFDLTEDPGETKNLLYERAAEAAIHKKILDLKMAEIAGIGSVEVDTVEIDPAALERLKALGYLGD